MGGVFAILIGIGIPLEIKVIDDEQIFRCGTLWSPATNCIEGSGMGPEPYAFVEWVRSSSIEQIQAAAIAAGLAFEVKDAMVIVYGYR